MRKPARLTPEELKPFLLDWPDPPAPLSWSALFGNDRPVELEVGFGKGLFLLNTSAARPDVNFVGVEIDRKYVYYAASRFAKRHRSNVRLVAGDARLFLRDCVAEGSLSAIHVYFPDPWWKKRHQKRRVFTAEFAQLCERSLRIGGLLHVATDVEDYFRMVEALLADRPGLQPLPPPEARGPEHDMDYLTNFERKFRKEGKPIYRGVYERRSELGT